jgi:hypothetical protein
MVNEIIQKPSKSTNNKRKGSGYERKVAKQLAIWVFEDADFIKRHPSSGADKSIFSGDVVPMKQLPVELWRQHFPFVIETKIGYPTHSPNFWKHEQVDKWYRKAYLEGLINNQPIVLLICQFKNKQALFMTNYLIDVNTFMFDVAFPIEVDNKIHYVYSYVFNKLLKEKFHSLFPIEGIMSEYCGL